MYPMVSDELWSRIEPLLPREKNRHVQSAGRRPIDRRRLIEWQKRGVWRKLFEVVLDELQSLGLIDWSLAIVDSA